MFRSFRFQCEISSETFFFASIDCYVNVGLFCVSSIYDQPQRRESNSFVGGNSLFGPLFSWSFNFRDVAEEMVSCDECSKKLSNGCDTLDCNVCYNWNINHNNIQYSEKAKDSINNYCTKPFKLCPRLQEEESKRIYNELSDGIIRKGEAEDMLMALCLPAKLKEDIVMSALQKYVKLNEIQDVDEVCPELLDTQLQREEESTGFPVVPIYLRKDYDYDNNTNAPMHLIPLGIIKKLVSEIHAIVRLMGVENQVIEDINETMHFLIEHNISFLNIEPFKNGNPKGWVGDNCLSFAKIMPYVYKNIDEILAKFYDTEDNKIEKWPKKMHKLFKIKENGTYKYSKGNEKKYN